MSTGYGWEGLRQVAYVRRCLVRAMYLTKSVAKQTKYSILYSIFISLSYLLNPFMPMVPF